MLLKKMKIASIVFKTLTEIATNAVHNGPWQVGRGETVALNMDELLVMVHSSDSNNIRISDGSESAILAVSNMASDQTSRERSIATGGTLALFSDIVGCWNGSDIGLGEIFVGTSTFDATNVVPSQEMHR